MKTQQETQGEVKVINSEESNYNVVLYANALFENDQYQQQSNAILNSGFTTIILWTLHIQENGDLSYNNTPIVESGKLNESFSNLSQQIRNLKCGGSVEQVIFGIGSASVSDFKNARKLYASSTGKDTLLGNFKVLVDNLPIDGFDFDLEESPLNNYTDIIVDLSLEFGNWGRFVTFCPFCQEDFWLNCLKRIYDKNSNQLVRWFNLQCYSGGSGNDPKAWADSIKNYPSPLGIEDSAAFVIPGYCCQNGTPDNIQLNFSTLKTSDPGINGGFIWNSGDIFNSKYIPKDYAQAIINGLE